METLIGGNGRSGALIVMFRPWKETSGVHRHSHHRLRRAAGCAAGAENPTCAVCHIIPRLGKASMIADPFL
jgi:hypothetical protein